VLIKDFRFEGSHINMEENARDDGLANVVFGSSDFNCW